MIPPAALAAVLFAFVLVGCGAAPPAPKVTADTITRPTSTPTPAAVVVPDRTAEPAPPPAPESVAPLTGVAVADAGVLDRPALAVKVENTAAARPQTGLDSADVVIEEVVEGGITRFIAIFHSQVPATVGNIRSARTVDVDVLTPFGPILAYSGAAAPIQAQIDASPLATHTHDGGDAGMHTTSTRPRPHNVYLDTAAALAVHPDHPAATSTGWTFRADPPGGTPTTSVQVRMSGAATTGWEYDPPAGLWRRLQDGRPHTVTGDGRIGAANVVVAAVQIRSAGGADAAGTPLVDITTTGRGPVSVFRDGVRVDGRWERDGVEEHFRFVHDSGDPIPLKPGPTWLHLAPATP